MPFVKICVTKEGDSPSVEQKEGKKRMKAIGKVNLPQEAFLSVLKID